MSALKTWVLTGLAWGAIATLARADAIPAPMEFKGWTTWAAVNGLSRLGTSHPGQSQGSGSVRSTTYANVILAPPPPAPAAVIESTPPPPPPAVVPPPPPMTHADAFLNFGSSNFPEQSALATGTAQAWYTSPSVTKVYGGTPTDAQQKDFIDSVANDVRQTFNTSGLRDGNTVTVTTDPGVSAQHTLSVVSGVWYGPNPGAIGITDVGHSGFSFIDKLSYASSTDELEWAVAHNISHELMHAFGVANHPDQTGSYLDAASASWSLLTSPSAVLSPDAVNDIIVQNVGRGGSSSGGLGGEFIEGDQEILETVPEPTTIALWGLSVVGLVFHQRRRVGRREASC